MIYGILITALVILVIIVGLIIALRITGARLKKAINETSRLNAAYHEVSKRAASLQAAQRQSVHIREEANAKKRELDSIDDADLIHRARNLFGDGVPGDSEGDASGN